MDDTSPGRRAADTAAILSCSLSRYALFPTQLVLDEALAAYIDGLAARAAPHDAGPAALDGFSKMAARGGIRCFDYGQALMI